MSTADWFQVIGLLMMFVGLALWSWALALLLVGAILFSAGGYATRQSATQERRR
jgi:hypothetical protein